MSPYTIHGKRFSYEVGSCTFTVIYRFEEVCCAIGILQIFFYYYFINSAED